MVPSGCSHSRRLLPGVPAPLRGQARAHSLAQALEIALNYAGVHLDYDAIMSLSGLAFRTPPWPEAPEPTREEWLAALERLATALGAELTVLGADAPMDATRALDAVAAAIDAGQPGVALGWGSVKEHWSVIAGYDEAKGALAGHCLLEEPREAYETWPATADLLVTGIAALRPRNEIAPSLIAAAISSGRPLTWAQAVRDSTQPLDAAHERALWLLADSRGAAAAFLERLAEVDDSIQGMWLAQAARHWHKLVDLLEARASSLFSPQADATLTGLADREDWAAHLDAVAHLDEMAFAALRRSSEAEFPPGEDEF